jgi:hypothetical protein
MAYRSRVQRGNTIRSRNARLAAIHSLFSFAALRHPEHAANIARVLAIPPKRADQTIVTFLTSPEADAHDHALDLGETVRAGEGNRTLMTSLEGWGSAIELRPRARRPDLRAR